MLLDLHLQTDFLHLKAQLVVHFLGAEEKVISLFGQLKDNLVVVVDRIGNQPDGPFPEAGGIIHRLVGAFHTLVLKDVLHKVPGQGVGFCRGKMFAVARKNVSQKAGDALQSAIMIFGKGAFHNIYQYGKEQIVDLMRCKLLLDIIVPVQPVYDRVHCGNKLHPLFEPFEKVKHHDPPLYPLYSSDNAPETDGSGSPGGGTARRPAGF